MDKERWNKVRQIFSHVSEQSPSFRTNYLDMVCEDDAVLRADVEKLLRGHDEVGSHPVFAEDQSSPVLPESIGQYRILSELGRGGMSVVYRALHPLHGSVALKVLPQNLISHPAANARFKQEAALLGKLQHPVVCRVLETGVLQNSAIIVMEEISGPTLESILRGKPLGFQLSVLVAWSLADALAEAHGAGIIHRDLKPANVLLTDGHSPRLIDFGIAKFADARLTATGEIMGSPAYMSPEQWRGEKVGPETDVWSLGILLYEMLTGAAPFSADSVGETAQRVLNDSLPVLPEKSSDGVPLIELQQLLKSMLEKKPPDRLASMFAVCKALDSIHVKTHRAVRD